MTTLSDTELFEHLRMATPGAGVAFTELYRRHHHWAYAYCLKVLGREEEAKDVFQETFIRVYRTAPQSETAVTNVAGLIMRICRNLCLNVQRDRKTTVEIEDIHLVVDTHHHYEKDELLDLIDAALDCLDAEDREVFVLRMYHDISYDEISRQTGLTVAAVKNRVWRAKSRIKVLLAPVLSEFDRL